MLKELKVKNFAIIEDIEVKFNKDMTVLTGQTGAGKSLIIDAISLILGARADLDMIRYGENESLITAVITDLSDEAIEALKNIGVDVKNEVTIVRQISNNNKSYIKINNQSVSLTQLKQISLFIGDIHVQHDTYRLINKDNYLSFLDYFKDNKFRDLYNKYQIDRVNYLNML